MDDNDDPKQPVGSIGRGDGAPTSSSSSSSSSDKTLEFRHVLPPHRLGTSHDSLETFRAAVVARRATTTTTTTTCSSHTSPSGCAASSPAGVSSPPPCMDNNEDKRNHRSSGQASLPGGTSGATCSSSSRTKEYSLIVVTTHDVRRVLLGLKHRGFGTGLYNSFGGKVEEGESIEDAARRELHEETNIGAEPAVMKNSRLGTLSFTFEDSPTEMIVHLFHVRIRLRTKEEGGSDDPQDSSDDDFSDRDRVDDDEFVQLVDAGAIRGCEEITPRWFKTDDVPLNNMFADDSVWLTRLLELRRHQHQMRRSSLEGAPVPRLDGWFHFAPGGADVNTILHYHLHLRMENHERVGEQVESDAECDSPTDAYDSPHRHAPTPDAGEEVVVPRAALVQRQLTPNGLQRSVRVPQGG